jgi:hypothetical protein
MRLFERILPKSPIQPFRGICHLSGCMVLRASVCRAAKAARDGLIGEAVNIFERQRAFGDVGPDFLNDMVMIDQRLRNPSRD